MKRQSSTPSLTKSGSPVPTLSPLQMPPDRLARQQAFSSIASQKVLLEHIASGESLSSVLTLMCQKIETQLPEMVVTILLLEGTTLRHVAAPRLPERFLHEIEGAMLDPEVWSCGTAAHQHRTTISVSDIETDARWTQYKDLALRCGFRACWSSQIFSTKAEVLGVFAMYLTEVRAPDDIHHGMIEVYAQLAGMAIERSRLEESLANNTSRFQQLIESANLIPWEADCSTWRLTYIGPQVGRLLDYPESYWTEEQAWERCIHPADRNWVTEECRKASEQRQEFELEYRVLRANGSTVWVRDLVSVIHGDDGKPKYLQGFLLDVTKQKEAEIAIQASEERLQAILDRSPALVFVKDSGGRYLFVNRQWENRFSQSRSDVLGKTMHEVFPQETADSLLANDRQVFQKQAPVEFEEEIPFQDGMHTYLSVKFPIPDFHQKSVAICGIATDITDRKRTEHLLQTQNAILQLLAGGESLPRVLDELCLLIEQQRPGTYCTVLLLEEDEKTFRLAAAPTMPQEFAQGLDGLTIGEFNGSCGAAAFHGEQVIVPDVRQDPRFAKFGDFPLRHGIRACWSTPFWGRGEKVLGSFCISHPSPCRPTRYDQQLMKMAAHLASISCERQATEQALRNSEAKLRQAQKMEAIGTLAGGIAHDFNNILTAILGFNELSRSFLPVTSPVYRYLEEVHAAGIRAKGLTKQILAFSRQADQELKPVHLPQVIEDGIRFLRATLPTTIEIKSTLKKTVNPIIADPVQIHQVLMNLCTNSAQAMVERGGELEVCLDHGVLTEEELCHVNGGGGSQQRSYVKLTIRDSGPGISPDILDRIFDPFFTTKESGDGVGLGLSVVHGIISNHQGGITVDSTPGCGTTFTIFLPELDVASIQDRNHNQPIKIGTGERILFVEDEEAIAHLGKEILKQLGYTVIVETQSERALEVFRHAPEAFDLVITDQTMPNMTGEVLSQELLRLRPDIPIILCTGYSPGMTPEKSRKLGIRAFLWKPLLLHDLSHTIHEVLSSR